ncbi:glycerol-3-phosphate acyltransferase PlsX [Thermoflexales bacterium]|nr:glycerol-3-phosphate acyltransferase PlsX [Thermoflexales bacterium]
MKIVVDAMGGDHAPAVVVEGAVLAAREFGVEIVLVGREEAIRRELARHNTAGLSLPIVPASEVIEMDDHVNAVRAKKDNSLSVGMRLIKEGQADAFMSAGNSGAVMAAALFGLGRIRGIDRPALASIFPASKTPAIFIDLGANTDPTPQNLVQFAMMGSVYAERILGLNQPRVAIVSNGEEPEKGNERVKAAYPLLQASGLNFIGNIEGKDIPQGLTDVIVTDGFTGNVIIKLTEGLVSFLARTLKESLTGSLRNKVGLGLMLPGLILMLPGMLFLLPTIQSLRKRVDYRELGAAPLLGVNGVVLIAHGRSDAQAIRGAIRSTIRAAEGRIVETIKSNIGAARPQASHGSPSAQA